MACLCATLLTVSFVLAGCDQQTLGKPEGVLECPDRRIVCIRVENSSDLDFETFEVNFDGQIVSYGTLSAGAISEYRVRLRLSFDMAPRTESHW